MRPPSWLPFLGPVIAVIAGALTARYAFEGGVIAVLATALVCGFAPIVGYRLWKRWHHRRPD